MKLLGVFACAIVGLVGLALLTRRFWDGPFGPLPGGLLRSGSLIAEQEIDWSALVDAGRIKIIELQLDESKTSRLVGVFHHEGELYASCDLGFVGHRAPGILMGWVQSIVSSLKNWHKHVEKDGRVMIRIQGNRYQRYATRVVDPLKIDEFKKLAVTEGIRFFGSLNPTEDVGHIVFIRLDPRDRCVGISTGCLGLTPIATIAVHAAVSHQLCSDVCALCSERRAFDSLLHFNHFLFLCIRLAVDAVERFDHS